MKIPRSLAPLVEDGLIDEVIAQLQSGKEATVYVVAAGDHVMCAKVYKNADHRSFQKVADYSEGRKTRRSRDARAKGRRSSHGKKVQHAEWKNAETETLYRLVAADVRVPAPYGVHNGVLLMELVLDAEGYPAPRLNEVPMSTEQALEWHAFMMQQVVRMLAADVVHGDLSEYNVLVGPDGPVIIDLPQAISATGNNQALRLLARDVNNMRATFSRAAPELKDTEYARELWYLYEAGKLKPDTVLTGVCDRVDPPADVEAVFEQIEQARLEAEEDRRLAQEEEWGD